MCLTSTDWERDGSENNISEDSELLSSRQDSFLKKETEVKHIILQETRNKDDISLVVAVTARNSKNMNIFHTLRKKTVTELEEEERLHFNSTERNSNGPNVLNKLDESKREHGESNRDYIPRSRYRDEEDKSVTNSDSSDS